MRFLGLDIGTKNIGVAITDKTGSICSPLSVIKNKNTFDVIKEIINIVEEFGVTEIAIGLPKNMDNTLGFAAKRSIDFKSELEKHVECDIHLVDERLTTVQAENILISNNYKRQKRKEHIDSVSAVLILEAYLRRKGNK